MSGPYQGRDLSSCGGGRLRVAINCGVQSVKLLGVAPLNCALGNPYTPHTHVISIRLLSLNSFFCLTPFRIYMYFKYHNRIGVNHVYIVNPEWHA